MVSPPPLTGIRVLELAGLAPGPYAGLLLSDYGASVLRVDRPSSSGAPTPDLLVRRKSSVALSLKDARGRALFLSLVGRADVLIDPYRPGVLESLGLAPESVLLALNPRLVVARMTGFRRDGKYAAMAGHDINYLAVSGVLSLLGRAGSPPHPPANLLGDFAGGGHVLFTGILMALLERARTGRGQVVEANMVDGAAHLATFPRLGLKGLAWSGPRGTNLLDGGCPFYDTYETKDGGFMAVGALEPQFYEQLLNGLGFADRDLPDRFDRDEWPVLRRAFENKFRERTRAEWEKVFDGTDACCTPVLELRELEKEGYDQRPLVTLRETPSFAISEHSGGSQPSDGQGQGIQGGGWAAKPLKPGQGGEEALRQWLSWTKGVDYEEKDGGLVALHKNAKSKL